MPVFNTAVVDAEFDVDRRLADFGHGREQYIAIGTVARARADDASPLMPLNAPGTLAYIFGVQELRQQLLGSGWIIDRTYGIEAIINTELGMRIAYQNVDRSCDLLFPPKPRSAKGSAAEGYSGPSLFEHAGIEPGPLPELRADGLKTYYVMVGDDASIELSCPVVQNGSFKNFEERIFIRYPPADTEEVTDGDLGPMEDFDVPVNFKAGT
jgi:hypothetical protein